MLPVLLLLIQITMCFTVLFLLHRYMVRKFLTAYHALELNFEKVHNEIWIRNKCDRVNDSPCFRGIFYTSKRNSER